VLIPDSSLWKTARWAALCKVIPGTYLFAGKRPTVSSNPGYILQDRADFMSDTVADKLLAVSRAAHSTGAVVRPCACNGRENRHA
jgi:hypothetical protein